MTQTHLSYDAYQKLCEKLGKEKLPTDISISLKKVAVSAIQEGSKVFPCIDMNVILSKEFIYLLDFEEHGKKHKIGNIALIYHSGGMSAVEEYILSLL